MAGLWLSSLRDVEGEREIIRQIREYGRLEQLAVEDVCPTFGVDGGTHQGLRSYDYQRIVESAKRRRGWQGPPRPKYEPMF